MNNTKLLQSIRLKLLLLVAVAIILSGFAMTKLIIPGVEKQITQVSQNYLQDLALAYGSILEDGIKADGVENTLSSENLDQVVAGVGMKGIESSYLYVVDAKGTMLYHPNKEKIGQSVENSVVLGLVDDIKAGKKIENKVVQYEFKGSQKYAATYVNSSKDFILVVSTDEDEILKPVTKVTTRGYIGLIIVFVLCFAISNFVLQRILLRPLYALRDLTMAISRMDFSKKSQQASLNARKDEIGQISKALAELKDQLSTVISGIRESSVSLVESANVLSAGARNTNTTMDQVESAVNDIANGATSQAQETQEATDNVLIMGDMVRDTKSTVDDLMDTAMLMKKANDNAQSIIRELQDINHQTDAYIDVIAKQTETTNESALKIGEATKLISDIADETNLLSLNAAIEAARAGEQGRGFAVVATEISKLAEQSTDSAKRIEEIIQELLLDSEKAVSTMTEVKTIINKQTKHIERTNEAFVEIQDGVTDSISGMQVIADKTSELDTARVNVVDVVNNLTVIAEQNAAATEETSASVVEVATIVNDIAEKARGLNQIAAELKEKTGVFKM